MKQERKSTYPSVVESGESEAEGSGPEPKKRTPNSARTRKSNVRTSWNSPAQLKGQSSASKSTPGSRSQPLRKVREK